MKKCKRSKILYNKLYFGGALVFLFCLHLFFSVHFLLKQKFVCNHYRLGITQNKLLQRLYKAVLNVKKV